MILIITGISSSLSRLKNLSEISEPNRFRSYVCNALSKLITPALSVISVYCIWLVF